MFFKSPKKIFGLDISDLSFKAVEVQKKNGKLAITAKSQIDIPASIIEDGLILKPTKVADLIKKMLAKSEGKFTSKYVVLSLPESKTFIKMLEIKNIDIKNKGVNGAIKNELTRHIPIDMEDLQIDWQEIKNGNSKHKFLVGAVEKTIRDSYVDVCELAELKVSALEIEAAAIVRSLLNPEKNPKKTLSAFEKSTRQKSKIIIDLGATRTSFILFDQGTIQFTSNVPSISGRAITKKISERKKVTLKEAEKLKKICGNEPNKCKGIVKNIIEETVDEIGKQIIDMEKFYQVHFNIDVSNAEIELCGGGANLKLIEMLLIEKLRRSVKTANPLTNIKIKPKEFFDSLSFTTAIGLSLRNYLGQDD